MPAAAAALARIANSLAAHARPAFRAHCRLSAALLRCFAIIARRCSGPSAGRDSSARVRRPRRLRGPFARARALRTAVMPVVPAAVGCCVAAAKR